MSTLQGEDGISTTWDIDVQPELAVTRNPEPLEFEAAFGETTRITLTANKAASFVWWDFEGNVVKNEDNVLESFYEYTGTAPGDYVVQCDITSGTETLTEFWVIVYGEEPTLNTSPPEGAIDVVQYDPDQIFEASTNVEASFQWVIDGLAAHTNSGFSSSISMPTGTPKSVNIVLNVDMGNVIESRSWTYTVEEKLVVTLDPVPSTITLDKGSGDFYIMADSNIDCKFTWGADPTNYYANTGFTSAYIQKTDLVGTFPVLLTVDAGTQTQTYSWTFEVVELLAFSFISPLPQTFDMLINDAETLTVTTNKVANFAWYVDGAEMSTDSGVSTSNYTFVPTQVKPYTVEVIATSGTETLSSSLSINSLQEPEEGTSMIPLLAAAGIGIYLLAGRKKEK